MFVECCPRSHPYWPELTASAVLLCSQPIPKGSPPPAPLTKCSQILEPLARAVPGLLEALYLQAHVSYLSGDVENAQSTLQHCLDQEASYSDAHILMAQASSDVIIISFDVIVGFGVYCNCCQLCCAFIMLS